MDLVVFLFASGSPPQTNPKCVAKKVVTVSRKEAVCQCKTEKLNPELVWDLGAY
jgi:hypothetical protein